MGLRPRPGGGRRRPRDVALVLLGALGLPPAARPADAQEGPPRAGPGAIVEASLRMAPGGDGALDVAEVEVGLLLEAGAAGSLPLRALLPDGVRLEGVRATVDGAPAPVTGMEGPGPRLEGSLALPAAASVGGGAGVGEGVRSAGPRRVTLRYRVVGGATPVGGGVRLVAPVVAPPWPPATALPGTFTAEAVLPPGLEAREGFPAAWRDVGDAGDAGGAVGGPRTLVSDLPVPPAFVRLLALPPGEGRFGPPFVATLALALVLAGAGVAGVRALAREAP